MNVKTILLPILLLLSINLKAEELPMFTIVELSVYANQIVEAEFLKNNDGAYVFLIKDLRSKGAFADTLRLQKLDRLYYKSRKDGVWFDNCEKIIFYLSDANEMGEDVVISGIRLLKDENIFVPFQPNNPGNYSFTAMQERVDWNVYKERIVKVHQRISSLKAFKNIEDPIEQNEQLFAWIHQFKNTFRKNCAWDADCGWGMLEWGVFQWIAKNNIAKDTWKASQLFREINANSEIEWHKGSHILHQEKGNSFKTYEDLDFLINIATNENKPVEERKQALVYMLPGVDIVYENNDPLVDSTNFAFQVEKQKTVRQTIYELMDHPELRSDAFLVVARLTNPLSYGLRHRTDLTHLPQIVEHYKKLLNDNYAGEESYTNTRYLSSLAYFIVRNSSPEEWRSLTNSDANILMNLGQVRVDTLRKTLSFSIYYKHGKEVINEIPTMVFTSVKDGEEYTIKKGCKIDLPMQRGTRHIKMDLKSLNLENGKYRCYVKGRAGEKNEYFWKSRQSKVLMISNE